MLINKIVVLQGEDRKVFTLDDDGSHGQFVRSVAEKVARNTDPIRRFSLGYVAPRELRGVVLEFEESGLLCRVHGHKMDVLPKNIDQILSTAVCCDPSEFRKGLESLTSGFATYFRASSGELVLILFANDSVGIFAEGSDSA